MIRLPAALISLFSSFVTILPTEVAGCEGVITECEVRDALKQVGLNKLPGVDGLTYEVAHVCTYSDGYVQPLVRPGSHPW